MQTLEILFIDDHPMILEGYRLTLQNCTNFKVNVHTKSCIDDAYEYIVKENELDKFDIIFFDISMSNSVKYNIANGVKLAELIKDATQHPKLAFITMLTDQILMDNIIKDINPDGILIKSEISPKTLKISISEIMSSPPCYSPSIKDKIRSKNYSSILLDEKDCEILNLLNKGVLTKNLHSTIPITQRAIEKRKRKIKILFGVEHKSDIGLIEEAKKRGFL